jgi:hypothetical protein
MLAAEKSNPRFGPAALLAQSGIGRRRMVLKSRETFFSQGDQADSVFYLPEWSGKAHSRVTRRQRGHDHAPLTWRICWRGILGDGAWTAAVHSNSREHLHGSQDHQGGDDPPVA